MPGQTRKSSTSGWFALCLVGALLVSLLPPGCTSWARSIRQPLGLIEQPLQHAAIALKQWGADPVSIPEDADVASLQSRNDVLQRQVAQLEQAFMALARDFDTATGIANQLGAADVRLVRAPVLGVTFDRRRDVLRIARGSVAGVRTGQWVAAGGDVLVDDDPNAAALTPINLAQANRRLLSRQWLIGAVTQVMPYEAVVTLLSDPDAQLAVRVARVNDVNTWDVLEGKSLLVGLGGGRMEIREASRDYYGQGARVVLAPASRQLPAPMLIGRVTASRRLDSTQLHFTLDVAPPARATELFTVFVINTGD